MSMHSAKSVQPPHLLSREPWWMKPPAPGQNELDCEWIYLDFYSDGSATIVHERPSDEEIRTRKSCRINPRLLDEFDAIPNQEKDRSVL